MALPFGKTIVLSNGRTIPQLGFGVYEISGAQCKRAVTQALEAGYRHIDSADWYGNESACGQAIRDFISASNGKVAREDIYFTSKLKSNSTTDHARKAIQKSVDVSGLGYLDLYLVHGPYPDKRSRLASWTALEAGVLKSIGVSNYGRRHLQELMDSKPKYLPAVNQIDVHPCMTRDEEVAFNESHGIKVEAWGPLARAERMNDPKLLDIAQSKGKTAAQVLIRWSLQRGFICIPKSITPSRIKENTNVFDFELSVNDMEQLNGLDEYLVSRTS